MATFVGTATTIAFGTSSFTAELLGLDGNDISREDIEVTHMGSTNYKEFIPSNLVDGGAVDMEILWDPDNQPPVVGVAETITITFPSALAVGAKLVFTGYVNSWSWGAPLEDKMTANFTMKVDGKTDPVWSIAATS